MSLTDVLFRGNRPPARRPIFHDEAIRADLSGKEEREVLANLTLQLWERLQEGFREDEREVEAANIAELAVSLQERLAALPPAVAPDPALMRLLLAVMDRALTARVSDLHARIDELADGHRATERELETQRLAGSWQTDEFERCRTMITAALRTRESWIPTRADGTLPLVSELLAALLHVQAPPPLPQAHAGKRTDADGNPLAASPTRERPAPSDDGASEGLPLLRKVLADVLDGTSQAPRLGHALEDLDLARRIGDLVAEHRSYRAILQRIGVLPKA